MPLPVEIARQLTEEQIAFVKRSGLKAEVLEPGFIRLRMPLQGNQNHIGSMYAGALFTLAEIPGGALFLTSFDAQRFYPIIKEMNLRFRRPATGDIQVEARLSAEQIAQLEEQANQQGKAEYLLELQLTDGSGEVGVISSVTQAFCSSCTRARLSTEGKIFTCLFATEGHDLRALLREGRSDEEMLSAIGAIWQQRGDRYSEIRTAETAAARKIEMSYIGG